MCICASVLIEATEQSQDSRVVSVLQEVNYNRTSMHGPVPYKSPKLDQTNLSFVNNPVELSERYKNTS